jgi:hypothetical protein
MGLTHRSFGSDPGPVFVPVSKIEGVPFRPSVEPAPRGESAPAIFGHVDNAGGPLPF